MIKIDLNLFKEWIETETSVFSDATGPYGKLKLFVDFVGGVFVKLNNEFLFEGNSSREDHLAQAIEVFETKLKELKEQYK